MQHCALSTRPDLFDRIREGRHRDPSNMVQASRGGGSTRLFSSVRFVREDGAAYNPEAQPSPVYIIPPEGDEILGAPEPVRMLFSQGGAQRADARISPLRWVGTTERFCPCKDGPP